MARIEGIRIKNFRALRDVTLGKVLSKQHPDPLTPMTAVIGKNGVGKSSLFDAFGFLADCLKLGVEEACDSRGRGGFERLRSQGVAVDPIIRFATPAWVRQRPPDVRVSTPPMTSRRRAR
jgi:predicted ATPase